MNRVKNALKTLTIDISLLDTTNLKNKADFLDRLNIIKKKAKKNYRWQVKLYHPDTSKEKDGIKFRRIDKAYKLIKKLYVSKNDNLANFPTGAIGIMISLDGLNVINSKTQNYYFSVQD